MFYNRKEFNNMLNSKTTTMKWHSSYTDIKLDI